MKIITNNPMVLSHIQNKGGEAKVASSLKDVLLKARDLIHINHKLVNHPLVTSIKPYENLFKTIVLIEADFLDLQSLSVIESAISKTEIFKGPVRMSITAKEDYQLIDYGVFLESIKQV